MTALDGVNGTVCNAQQYHQYLESLHSRSPSISCLTHEDSIGLVFIAEAASLSCICLSIIFIWIVWNIHWYKKTFPNGDWKLFQRPVDIYMFSLFVFDLSQATGGIINIRWAHNGIVTTGPYCTAQGIVEQIGALGAALSILLLAVHTFVGAVLQVGLKARGVAFGLVGLACVIVTLCVANGAGIHNNYNTPTPYWCWISPQYLGERLGGQYILIWIALFASVILYIPLHFWAEGFWSVDGGYKFHWRSPDQRIGYAQRRATLGMLLYPLAYAIIAIPITFARWLRVHHHAVSSATAFFANSIFHLSGAVNVVVFLIARPRLLLFTRPKELDGQEIQLTPAPQVTDPENFSDTEKFQRSPEPTSAAPENGGSKDSATPCDVKSRRISEDI